MYSQLHLELSRGALKSFNSEMELLIERHEYDKYKTRILSHVLFYTPPPKKSVSTKHVIQVPAGSFELHIKLKMGSFSAFLSQFVLYLPSKIWMICFQLIIHFEWTSESNGGSLAGQR